MKMSKGLDLLWIMPSNSIVAFLNFILELAVALGLTRLSVIATKTLSYIVSKIKCESQLSTISIPICIEIDAAVWV